MKGGAALIALIGVGALALSGSAKAQPPPQNPHGPDEVPDAIVDRVVKAIATDDPKAMRAEAAKLRAEGYTAQAAALETAATTVEQRNRTQPAPTPSVRLLKQGMQGEDVRDWQKLLARDGFASVKADAIFGPITTTATKGWQTQRGLKADGVVGPATRAKIGTAPLAAAPAVPTPAASVPAAPAASSTPKAPTPASSTPKAPTPASSTPKAPTPAPVVSLPNTPATAASATGTRILKSGSTGADVKAWQSQLQRDGYSQVKADGVFGPITVAATKAWQAQRGLPADGAVGPNTRAKIGSAPTVLAPAAAPPAAPAPSSTLRPDTWRTMRRGSAGADVKEWQTFLSGYGAALTPDGKFGPATETASKAWQASQGLSADGVVGPATRARVVSVLASRSVIAGPLDDPEPFELQADSGAAMDPAELASALAAHLQSVTPGHEDRELVRRFQRLCHLNDTGQYGPSTAEALLAFAVVPPRPFYWPTKGASKARTRYKLALRTRAAQDPERSAALLAAAGA